MRGTKFNTTRIIVFGFMAIILLGAFLLTLPVCSATGQWTDFLTALFTSTTSICVTGLVVVPTFAYWSLTGKIVILILIQIGGLGVICLTIGLLILIGRRISLKQRRLIQEAYNLDSSQGVIKLVQGIFIMTIIFEGIGALLYSTRFIPRYGFVKGVWYSVFHAVSAFCNAGIDILDTNSLQPYIGDVLMNLTTAGLIMVGGIGFIVWWDIRKVFKEIFRGKLSPRKILERLTLHTKVALSMTAILLLLGTVLILIAEFTNKKTIGDLCFGNKVMAAFFQSVTLRTAGFFTIDQQYLRGGTFIISCILMFIGGSPVGTAGGIKTTTMAALLIEVRSVIRGHNSAQTFRRKLRREDVRTALTVIMVTLIVLITAITLLTITEGIGLDTSGGGEKLEKVFFEAFSAMGTVGLTMGLTPELSAVGKVIIIFLMYFGRIGPVTIAMAFAKRKDTDSHGKELAEKTIFVG